MCVCVGGGLHSSGKGCLFRWGLGVGGCLWDDGGCCFSTFTGDGVGGLCRGVSIVSVRIYFFSSFRLFEALSGIHVKLVTA